HRCGNPGVAFCSRGPYPKAGGAGGNEFSFWRRSRQPKIAQITSVHAAASINVKTISMALKTVANSLVGKPRSLIIIGNHRYRALTTKMAAIEMTKAVIANSETRGCRRHRDNDSAIPIAQTMMIGASVAIFQSNDPMRQTSLCECAKAPYQ